LDSTQSCYHYKKAEQKERPWGQGYVSSAFLIELEKMAEISCILQGIKKIKQTTTKKTAKIQLNG